jgi:hypothetical protein
MDIVVLSAAQKPPMLATTIVDIASTAYINFIRDNALYLINPSGFG